MKYTIESVSTNINARLVIKGFRTSDAMHKFLNTGSNALKWRESNKGLKSGTYFEQYDSDTRSFKAINVKELYS